MENQRKNDIFSVIVPIYNVENYLEEALQSVTDQTIGFENIQLILVNDGSPDDSDRICKRYQAQYPDQVLYIKKENGGVSSARNKGLDNAVGRYVVFLDGDDTWDKNAFKRVKDFFDDNGDRFDVCSCRIIFSGDFKGKEHPLDYKFLDGIRTADLMEEPVMVSSTIGNSVFRREAIGDLRFKEGLFAGEDSEFVNTLLLDKPVIGIHPQALFYYRRNLGKGNSSSSATGKKEWYLDVPRDYYGSLCAKSLEKHGRILPFIQHVILYDMRWRFNRNNVRSLLSEEERRQYIETLHQIVKDFDPAVIRDVKDIDQYKKLYYMNLKYGREIIREAELRQSKLMMDGFALINLHRQSILNISVLEIEDGELLIEGISKAAVLQRDHSLFAKVGKNKYELSLTRYKDRDEKGFVGETITEANLFSVRVPVRANTEIAFYMQIDGKKVKLWPGYNPFICHTPYTKGYRYENGYAIRDGYLLKCEKQQIAVIKDSKRNRLPAWINLYREAVKNAGRDGARECLSGMLLENSIRSSRIKDRAAFITIRSDGELNENMERIYRLLDAPKVKFAKKNLYEDSRMTKKAAKLIYSSKVVVTDDYLFLFRAYGKKRGQYFVQLWHATGAGKRFGKDGGTLLPQVDRLYHKDYDIVTVSGEASREAFASAFDIPAEKLQLTGVSRTDLFFDEKEKDMAAERVLGKHPELRGKKVILYTPTFRDVDDVGRNVFRPDLDFADLSAALPPDSIFVIKPHPVMTEAIVEGTYKNIIEVRDVETNDMMIVSDMMITDYSSTFFEYALLRKPMAFFCYDYDTYERDFYIDFENDLPGEILRTQEELFRYLRQEEHPIAEKYDAFYKKYMGACDGHSSERIAEVIKNLIYEK